MERFVLFLRPDKLSRIDAHPSTEKICSHVDYLRQYYRKADTEYIDKSSTYWWKIDIKSTNEEIRMYLNQDLEGSADFAVSGIGLIKDTSNTLALKILLSFNESNICLNGIRYKAIVNT